MRNGTTVFLTGVEVAIAVFLATGAGPACSADLPRPPPPPRADAGIRSSAGAICELLAPGPGAGCCPGQTCNAEVEECADTYVVCQQDSDCPAVGEYCEPQLGEFPSGPGCTFRSCSADTDCAAGLRCFNSSCVGEAPCAGGCPAGTICTTATNLCTGPATSSASCSQTCAEGTMLVFSDGRNLFNSCSRTEAASCDCLAIPRFPDRGAPDAG